MGVPHKDKLRVGDTVYVSKDDDQWGRIAEVGAVVEVTADDVLVAIGGTIRANVICEFNEVQFLCR